MAEHPHATMFREAMDKFNAGDMDAFVAMLADDVEWYTVGGDRLAGKEAVKQSFTGGGDYEIHGTVHDVVANDEHTIALIEATAHRGDQTLDYRTAEIMHIRDGKVTHRWSLASNTQKVLDFFK